MAQTAKLFMNGRSQAVRLPAEFRFDGVEVFIRRDGETGDVILSKASDSWDDFVQLVKRSNLPKDFMDDRRDEPPRDRNIF